MGGGDQTGGSDQTGGGVRERDGGNQPYQQKC